MLDRSYIKLKIGDIVKHEDKRSKLIMQIIDDESEHWFLKVIRILPYNQFDEPLHVKIGSIHILTNGQMQFYKKCTYNLNAIWNEINT